MQPEVAQTLTGGKCMAVHKDQDGSPQAPSNNIQIMDGYAQMKT
jgi:hypothetical protein